MTEPRIAFQHIQRTGCTSIISQIVGAIAARRVVAINHPYTGTVPQHSEDDTIAKIAQGANFDLIVGHFSSNLVPRLPVDWRWVVVVRNPIERAWSLYGYKRRYERFAGGPEQFLEAYEHRVKNWQCIMISGYQDAVRALSRIEARAHIAAEFENRDIVCRELQASLRVPISTGVRLLSGIEERPPRWWRRTIEPLVEQDLILWEGLRELNGYSTCH